MACAAKPPSYEEACNLTVELPPPYTSLPLNNGYDNDTRTTRPVYDVNGLIYSKLEYSQRDDGIDPPDIYFENRKILDKDGTEFVARSGKDGPTFQYELLTIAGKKSALNHFVRSFGSSKSSQKKAKQCSVLHVDCHIVFRYTLTTTDNEGSSRVVYYIDYENPEIPRDKLLAAKGREVINESGESLSPITRKQLCHKIIREKSKEFLERHGQKGRMEKGTHQVQMVHIFPVQVASCSYKNKRFCFYLIGEEAVVHVPQQRRANIRFLKNWK